MNSESGDSLLEVRKDKISILQSNNIIVYSDGFPNGENISDAQSVNSEKTIIADNVSGILSKETNEVISIKTSGRVMGIRGSGNLIFMTIQDETGEIQLALKKDAFSFNSGIETFNSSINIDGEELELNKFLDKFLDLGDFVGISGRIFTNKKEQRVIAVKEIKILSKSLKSLPEKFHGLNEDKRFSNQVEWLISDKEAKEKIKFRNEFVWQLRKFYHNLDFEEVETPILNNFASGAAAKPFVTYHEDFGQDFFLRISKEPKLKMAMAAFSGGKFYEIAKDFRNEGSSSTHMQEFTMVEHYRKNWTNDDNINFLKEMFNYIFSNMDLDFKRLIPDNDGNVKEVDFGKEWEEINYIDGINEASGLDITSYNEGEEERFINDIKEKGHYWKGMESMGISTLTDYLFKKVLRPNIIGPTIVRNYPRFMQPFARPLDGNEDIVDQAQLIINGAEIVKMYSELIDPIIQEENFNQQAIALKRGDEEAIDGDLEFLGAMQQGMPPMAGLGMGIERIVMMLVGSKNIKDVTLFPLAKK